MKSYLLYSVLCCFAVANARNQPRITIENGVLVGAYVTTENGYIYKKFEGIPYAKPPVDDRRFKEAERLEHWIGEWNATSMGSPCLQVDHFKRNYDENGDPIYEVHGSEDCLFLNVYTREGGPSNKNVIVFIHGGAFMFGGSNYYGVEHVMESDKIVYVTINYRLGPLGFLTTGDSYLPGNNGLKDQSAALDWVQRNIAAFGGDPTRVTITGLSAGGASVHYHYLSPLSRGLFSQGYSYSGTALCPWALVKDGVEKTKKLANYVGCPTTDSKVIIKCLRKRPAHQIVEQVKNFHSWMYNPFTVFGPVVEVGSPRPFIDKTPLEILKNGENHNLPWMTGFTTEDGLYPVADFIDNDRFLAQLNERWETLAPDLLFYSQEPKDVIARKLKEIYLGNKNFSKESTTEIMKMFTDRLFLGPAVKASILQARVNTQPVYLYEYGYVADKSTSNYMSESETIFGSSHGDDTAHVIKIYGIHIGESSGSRTMSKELMNLLLTFADTGAPPRSLKWEPVSKKSSRNILLLNIMNPHSMKMEERNDLGNLKKWATVLENLPVKEEL